MYLVKLFSGVSEGSAEPIVKSATQSAPTAKIRIPPILMVAVAIAVLPITSFPRILTPIHLIIFILEVYFDLFFIDLLIDEPF